MSQPNECQPESIFYPLPIIPREVLFEYFDVLENRKPLYVVTVTEGSKPTVFLEKCDENPDMAIVRVFFRYNDAISYIAMVAEDLSVNPEIFHSWMTNADDLSSVLHYLSVSEGGEPKLRAVSSLKKLDDFIDVDIFWTSEPTLMV